MRAKVQTTEDKDSYRVFVCVSSVLTLTDDHCGTADITRARELVCVCGRARDRGMDTAGNVLFDRHSGCLDTHVM